MRRAKNNVNNITLINIISTFILQGIAFISTPLFTRLLGPSQYGLFSLFNSWVMILTCIMGAGMHSSIGTGLYTFKEDYKNFRNNILITSSLICMIEVIVIIAFSRYISGFLGFSSSIILVMSLCAFANYILNLAQSCFIYEKRASHNFILSVLVSVSSVLLSLYLIYHSVFEKKYIDRIYGVAIVYIIAAICVWIILFLEKPSKIQKRYVNYGLVVGFPIVFHTLSQQILGQSDRVMMQLFGIATAEIGIYSLFYTLSSVLSTILGALNNSWCPFYYDDVSEKKWDTLDKKCKNYIELFTVLGVGFLLLSREVSYLMADKSYWGGINILPILTLGIYFTFMYQFLVNYEFFYKKTYLIAIGTIITGLINIILNIIMIPSWGMYGAAIATAISYLALFFAHFYIVTHMKNLTYHLKIRAFIPGLAGMLIGCLAFYVLAPWWYIRWGLGLILGCFEAFRIYKRKSIF